MHWLRKFCSSCRLRSQKMFVNSFCVREFGYIYLNVPYAARLPFLSNAGLALNGLDAILESYARRHLLRNGKEQWHTALQTVESEYSLICEARSNTLS